MSPTLRILGEALFYAGFGYLSGSLAFSVWITRAFKGVDVRHAGSGHATTTNTIRSAGWPAGILVLALDIAKGFLPVYLAAHYASASWIAAIAGVAAVAGHCWPFLAGFHGGMGLATAGGGFLALGPVYFLVGLGILIALVLLLRHAARAAIITVLAYPVVLAGLGQRGPLLLLAALSGLVIAFRYSSDWRRKYRGLWLDRPST